MANRRMFTKTIVDSDWFLEMPLSTQCLYFHLNMRADDDGFINNPKRIAKLIGATEDDLRLLITKRFVLVFESGVIVIKHWRMHNTIRKDRYTETEYQEEFAQLDIKENGSYTEKDKKNVIAWQPNGNQMATTQPQVSLGKVKLGKDSNNITPTSVKKFVKPSVEEVEAYCKNNGYEVDAQYFIDYYESKGWLIGKSSMKDWKAAIRMWVRNNKNWEPKNKMPDFTLKKKERKLIAEDEEILRRLREG